jgi:hypothetical protein
MRVVSQSPDPSGKMHTMTKDSRVENGFWPRSIFLGVCGSGGDRLSRQPGREAELVERFGLGQWIHLGNGMGFAGGSLRRVTWLGSRSEPGLFARSLRRELGAPASMATRSPMPKLSRLIGAISIPEASR